MEEASNLDREAPISVPANEWANFDVPLDVWEGVVSQVKEIPKMPTDIKFTREISLQKDLKVDSLDLQDLLMHCETYFGIQISDELAQICTNLGEFASLIAWLVAKKPPATS